MGTETAVSRRLAFQEFQEVKSFSEEGLTTERIPGRRTQVERNKLISYMDMCSCMYVWMSVHVCACGGQRLMLVSSYISFHLSF